MTPLEMIKELKITTTQRQDSTCPRRLQEAGAGLREADDRNAFMGSSAGRDESAGHLPDYWTKSERATLACPPPKSKGGHTTRSKQEQTKWIRLKTIDRKALYRACDQANICLKNKQSFGKDRSRKRSRSWK